MQTDAHLLAGTCRLVLDRFDVDSNCRLETLAAEGTKKKGPKPASGPFARCPSRLGRSTEIRHFEVRLADIVRFVTHFLHPPLEADLPSFLLL